MLSSLMLSAFVATLSADAHLPASFEPLVYEAEQYSTPKDAWLADKSTANRWNLWSKDPNGKHWSGGAVLQSPTVKADRNSPEEGAPALHTHVTGIPRGRYEVEIKLGRTLAVSRDGKTWEKRNGTDPVLGVVTITDGTFDLWVDDRYVHTANPGAGYYDCLLFRPVPERVEKPRVDGFASHRIEEPLDRGLVATPAGEGRVYVGWRLLASDPPGVAFDVYRTEAGKSPVQINAAPIRQTTDFVDASARPGSDYVYSVRTVGGKQAAAGSAKVRSEKEPAGYLSIKLDPGTTVQKVGVGDLDGDGRYDYVLKTPQDNIDPALPWWTPSPDTYKLEAYNQEGRRLWRKDLGWAIERGIWYSPYIVFDFDGDGRAEVAVKTGQGDCRGPDGRVETGPEWVSILDGATGNELARDDWPSRQTPGEKYNYNLSSRNQMCVAYLDGRTPCLLVERGTYTTIRLVAYQFRRGRGLEKLWSWDSREEAGRGRYNSQGAHIMHAADVDGDGRDEVVIGSAVVDDNGNGLWTTGFGHPDFCFVGDIDPARPGLEIFYGIEVPHEQNGLCLVDARTGKLLWGLQQATGHVGTDGMCADIDAAYPGSECHAVNLDAKRQRDKGWLFSAQGGMLSDARQPTMSLPVYWDADPQRELVRGRDICDFQMPSAATPANKQTVKKHPPQLTGHVVAIADVLGDWREEIITSSPGELRIYTTTIPARDRHVCLMQDPIYRIDVAVSTMGYYAAPMLSYDMATKSKGPAKAK
jgi:hypothetical protein